MLIWVLRIVPALILLQTLRYKFSGHRESKEIFTQLNLLGLPESYGRIGSGILELILSVLILIPQTSDVGSVGVMILMIGAIGGHLTKLGFKENRLPLFLSALTAFLCCLFLLI